MSDILGVGLMIYPVGSPTRLAIQYAYAATRKCMLIAGAVVMALSLVCVLVIRDINVKIQLTKGLVF
jgi:hypothetical protein